MFLCLVPLPVPNFMGVQEVICVQEIISSYEGVVLPLWSVGMEMINSMLDQIGYLVGGMI
jgi:hypothetical protein